MVIYKANYDKVKARFLICGVTSNNITLISMSCTDEILIRKTLTIFSQFFIDNKNKLCNRHAVNRI